MERQRYEHVRGRLAELVEKLDLRDSVHVGHSTGGARSFATSSVTVRVALPRPCLIASVPPIMLKTPANPGGLPMSVFDGFRAQVHADRAQFFKDLSAAFLRRQPAGLQRLAGTSRLRFGCRACSPGFRRRTIVSRPFPRPTSPKILRNWMFPTLLIIAGDDDQIVPIWPDAALLQAKLIKGADAQGL